MPKEGIHHILIAGERRSGTTFLANLLNSQKEATVIPNIYVEFFRPFSEYKLFSNRHKLDFTKELTVKEKTLYLKEIKKTLKAYDKRKTIDFSISQEDFNTLTDLYKLCLSLIPEKNDSIYLGHKIDRPVFCNIENILDEVNIKVIYIYRDPRDVILSANIVWPYNSSVKTMKKWKTQVGQAIAFQHPSFLLIKHENLIRKEKETIDSMNNFLGFEIDTDLKKLYNYNDEWNANEHSSFNDVVSPFDVNAIERWKKDPKKKIYRYCAGQGKEYLKKLEYPESEEIKRIDEIFYVVSDFIKTNYHCIKRFYIRKIKKSIMEFLYKNYVWMKRLIKKSS